MASPVAPAASSVPFTGGDSPSPLGDKSPLLFTWPFSCGAEGTAVRVRTLAHSSPPLFPSRQRGPDSFCSLTPHPGPRQTSPPALAGALGPRAEAAASRRRWGPVAPTHFPGARSPFRADPQAAAGPGGPAAVPAEIGREATPGRCSRHLDGPCPGFLLRANRPPPTAGSPLIPTNPWKRAAGHRGEGTRPAAPGRLLGAALCSPRGTRGGPGAAPRAGAANKEGGGARPAPPPRPSPRFARGGCGAENKGTRRGRGLPRVPGRTKRAAPARGPGGDEVREEEAGAGRARRTHLSVGLSGGSACCLLGGHVAPGSLGALAAHDAGGLLGGGRPEPPRARAAGETR